MLEDPRLPESPYVAAAYMSSSLLPQYNTTAAFSPTQSFSVLVFYNPILLYYRYFFFAPATDADAGAATEGNEGDLNLVFQN